MDRKFSKEIRVGAFIFAALSVMVLVVFMLGGQSRLFVRKATYKILFRSTTGLFKGDPVLLTGVEVGNVTKIGFPEKIEEKKILLEIAVDHAVVSRIRRDTRARLGSASLVYGKVVELTMGSSDEPPVPEGGFIPADWGSRYDAIVDSTSMMLEDARLILSKLNRGDGALGILLNRSMDIPRTLHYLTRSTQNLSQILEQLNRGRGPLGAMLSDSVDFRKTMQEIQSAVSDLKAVTSNLKNNRSVMGKLINDPQYGEEVLKDLRSAAHSLASITAKIDTGKGTLGWLINDPELYIGIQDVVVGAEKSKLTRWFIQSRRKAGEKERAKDIKGKE